jgi:hypothetical protein
MKTFVKYHLPILHLMTMGIYVLIFYIGGINLLTSDSAIFPIQLLILALSYPTTLFTIRQTNLLEEIDKWQKESETKDKHK